MSNDGKNDLSRLRADIDALNDELLTLLNKRARTVARLAPIKEQQGVPPYDPVREADQLQRLQRKNRGPMTNAMVERVFRAVFAASLTQQLDETAGAPLVMGHTGQPRIVQFGNVTIGGGKPVLMAGPCAVEDEESLEQVAAALARRHIPVLRGGAFKPRKSPYTFQGLGLEGIEMLAAAARRHGLAVVSEITDPQQLPHFEKYVDLVQVGAHNMFNTELLKALGSSSRPVLLKRNMAATMEELLLAAEYLYAGGNRNVVLCERGIRTFEEATRYTLDIAAVGLIKERTDLPVIVDVSHAAGRRDLLVRLGRAALAAGADGLMVEVHPRPEAALSDAAQQLNFDQFDSFLRGLEPLLEQA